LTEQRKTQIISCLNVIVDNFAPSDEEQELTMFGLISEYNAAHDNPELIGGAWVREHVPELADLP